MIRKDLQALSNPNFFSIFNLSHIIRSAVPGKNLGKYSFRNAEGNWPISTDIGIMQEYYCHTLLNCRYYIYYSSLCTVVQGFGNCRATWVKIPETFYELLIFSCEFSKMKTPLAEIVKYDQS